MKKKRAIEEVSFAETIALVKEVLVPVVRAVQAGKKYVKKWLCDEQRWGQ